MSTLSVHRSTGPASSALQRCINESSRPEAAQYLAEIVATLERSGYDCSEMILLGEGSESSAYQVTWVAGRVRVFRVLKLTSPLSLGWEPDWGYRSIDAQMFPVDGEDVHEMEGRTYWYVQELAQTFSRATDIDEDLLEAFELELERIGENLYLDDTGLAKQIGLVERNEGPLVVLIDYGALGAGDHNRAY